MVASSAFVYFVHYLQRALLRALTTQITEPIMAASRTTGSASIKTGILPCVSVTIVEKSRTREIPDAITTIPFLSTGLNLAMK